MRGWIGIRGGASMAIACHNGDPDEEKKSQSQHAIVRLPHHAHVVPSFCYDLSQPKTTFRVPIRKKAGTFYVFGGAGSMEEVEPAISVSVARKNIEDYW